ncbi:uncharacterized protein [Diadema antillarum]|uniref:uncharacterized protein n=1 Tax=Diadema antillarum TaxID=105358 RepID=UPI003A8BFB84
MARSSESLRPVVICAILLALAASLVALILSSISIAKNNDGTIEVNARAQTRENKTQSQTSQDRVWTIAISDYGVNLEYLEESTYEIKGYNVDIVNAVCALANKTCILVCDVNERCWDTPPRQRARGGVGLMARWYDACTGWVNTYDRSLTFAFTRAFVKKQRDVALYAVNSSSVDYRNVKGLTVGFIAGWAADERCLARYARSADITGASPEFFHILHYNSPMGLMQGLRRGESDVAFSIRLPQLESDFRRLTPDDFPNYCYPDGSGAGMMTRKDNTEFINWWNEAFDRLVGTPEYDKICERLSTEHGHKQGSGAKDVCIGY